MQGNHIVKSNNDDNGNNEVNLPGPDRENSFNFMNESLTSMNTMLLRETRKENKRLKYEFLGHGINCKIWLKV